MYFCPKPQHKDLLSESRVYNRPHLLAAALHQLDRLAEKRGVRLEKTKWASLGSVVELLYLEENERVRFELVTPSSASKKDGKISVFSLMGSNLLGRKIGEIAQIKLCGRSFRFRILNIF